MIQHTAHVPLPDVTFTEGTPISTMFDDVYFSKHGGISETEHVFLQGNGLPEGWAGRTHFTIGELGFGTGLNFLVAWRAFTRTAAADAHLHYIAIEKFPLTSEMLRTALAMQPELAKEAAALLAAYPLRVPGIHRLHLSRATLTLCYGDAAELLPQLNARIDAWFLDGFAPAKNPDMWSEQVLHHIGRLSAPDARLATFTAAGAVKRGLAAQGFAMEKTQGYGHKRDMLIGRRSAPALVREISSGPILILGGGIAGCTLARTLAERGREVTILERSEIAAGASGNPAAVLFPPLNKRWTPMMDWYFTAYGFTLRQLAHWRTMGLDFTHDTPGMLRLPRYAEEETQWRELHEMLGLDPTIVDWIERDEATARTGLELLTGGVWFAHGTWVVPPSLCRALINHPRITLHTGVAAESLTSTDQGWRVTTETGETFEASMCCIATAQESQKFLTDHDIKLHAVAGQVSLLNTADTSATLRTILCHKGYVIPQGEHYLIGATYNHGDEAGTVTAENHMRNIAELENFLPDWFSGAAISGRTSFRATTPDRLPYIGQIAPGLFVSTGHGSRGMISAPLAAEVIASEICGEQVPLTDRLRKAINPHRFR